MLQRLRLSWSSQGQKATDLMTRGQRKGRGTTLGEGALSRQRDEARHTWHGAHLLL